MTEDKGNIIYEFLKRLNECDDLAFADIAKNKIDANNDGEILDFIKENDIIRSKKGKFDYDALVYITKNGKNILEYGSWKEYIDFKNNEHQKIISEKTNRKNIKHEIEQLTLSELKHKEKIREQENTIRDLSEQLTRINLLKAYWWVIGIGFGLGLLMRELYNSLF